MLGPNGTGKTTLLRSCSASCRCRAGTVEVDGQRAAPGQQRIGYVPQQRAFDRDLPMRGRDLVRFGLDGHRPGMLLAGAARAGDASTQVLRAVGAAALRRRAGRPPVGR